MSVIKPKRVQGFVELEHAPIIYKNFGGHERGRYNPEGYRNFCVVIEDHILADQMKEDGWNVKMQLPRDGEGEPRLYLPVAVSYNNRPPMIVAVSAEGKQTKLDEEDLDFLDENDIAYGDVALNPYNWEMNGNMGVKAYLKTGYFVLEKVPFADKYSEGDISE